VVNGRSRARAGRDRPRWWRYLAPALTIVAVAAWMVWLRPQSLGGRAGYIIVRGTSMRPTLLAGDLVVVRHQRHYRVGQVVTYRIPSGEFRGQRIIHRIVGGSEADGFVMRGDNKPDADLWHPRAADVVGRRVLRLPGFGRALLFLRSPSVFAALAAAIAFAVTMTWKTPSAWRGPRTPPARAPR
jgi:signal peptidase I